jgi:hypothetical protein
MFYKLVMDGKTKRIRLDWFRHPEKSLGLNCIWPAPNEKDMDRLRDKWAPREKLTSPWRDKEELRRTAREMAQEIDIDYLGAGAMVFDGRATESLQLYIKLPEVIQAYLSPRLESLTWEEVHEPFNKEGYLIVYEKPQAGHFYSTGFDIVEGRADGDFFVGLVLDRITKNVVARYYSHEDEVTAARIIAAITKYYTLDEEAPWCGIETNGPGLATFDRAVELDVSNLFMAPRFDVTNGTVSYKKGWRTDTASRNELIAGIRDYLIDQAGALNSQRLIGELFTFVRNATGRAEAQAGCHDDEVFAFGIALQVDQLAPMGTNEVEEIRDAEREDFYWPKRAQTDPQENSIEARCLATAIQRKFTNNEQAFFEAA